MSSGTTYKAVTPEFLNIKFTFNDEFYEFALQELLWIQEQDFAEMSFQDLDVQWNKCGRYSLGIYRLLLQIERTIEEKKETLNQWKGSNREAVTSDIIARRNKQVQEGKAVKSWFGSITAAEFEEAILATPTIGGEYREQTEEIRRLTAIASQLRQVVRVIDNRAYQLQDVANRRFSEQMQELRSQERMLS